MKEAAALDPRDVERAQAFWADEDVDEMFDDVFSYLEHLKMVLKRNTATDRELVQALKLLETLDVCPSVQDSLDVCPSVQDSLDVCPSVQDSLDVCPSVQDPSVVQMVISSGEVLPTDFPRHSPSPLTSPLTSPVPRTTSLYRPAAPPAVREGLLPPLAPVQLQYRPHTCCKRCMPSLPSMPQSMPLFWAQNPLKVPLLCGFKRLSALPLVATGEGVEPADADDWDVFYRAPCGQSLRNHDDVMDFLLAAEICDVLQVDFFTFSRFVHLDPPVAPGSQRPELDLSHGVEPTPVELCPGNGGARPAEFRYRRDRWPHGCFLSRGPALFAACCDCVDGCTDALSCACIAMNRGGRCYTHHRLSEPEPSGLYECGPWCGCDRARCQNRLVQRGIRIRLQVFQTEDRGWGVRCRDDVDRGTFVCIYAGVILQRLQTPLEPPPPKLARFDLPSDDEVEVVTEWLAPPVLEGRSDLLESTSPLPISLPTSPPLHVPVIQRPPDAAAPQVRSAMVGGPKPTPPSVTGCRPSGDQTLDELRVTMETVRKGNLKSDAVAEVEDVYVLDASREGNVSRFFNHSCRPNLFVQNVFTDSHDRAFPVIAFFTSRRVGAGTELTWNYSSDGTPAALPKQEVACLCGSDGCRDAMPYDPQLCYILDGFLGLYGLVITGMFIREKFFKPKVKSEDFQESDDDGNSGQTRDSERRRNRWLNDDSTYTGLNRRTDGEYKELRVKRERQKNNEQVYQDLRSVTRDTYDALQMQPLPVR